REKVFLSQVVHSGEITDMELPAHIEAGVWADLALELLAQQAASAELDETDVAENPPNPQAEQAQREKWEAYEEQRANEIFAKMQATRRRDEEHFSRLATYYLHRTGLERIAYHRSLHLVLRRFASQRRLSISEVAALEQILRRLGHRQAAVAAACYELLAAHERNRHYLPTACHYWREAELPERVLEIAVPSDGDSAALQTMLLNTRSAALADMECWSEARQTAYRASRTQPSSKHSFNVLGRIAYATGAADLAQHYFTRAQHGSTDRPPASSAKGPLPHRNEDLE
ncbi:MAG TPA: hypothetical protein VF276_08025, partial [Chloroflexia bacterium]